MASTSHKRINITLPEETLELIDQHRSESRSSFINKAVQTYARRLGMDKADIRHKLRRAYLERGDEGLEMAQEWNSLASLKGLLEDIDITAEEIDEVEYKLDEHEDF